MQEGRPPLDLEHGYRVLRRGWTALVFVALGAAVVAVGATAVQGTRYKAETKVLVRDLPAAASRLAPARNIATEGEVIASPRVADAVRDDLGIRESATSILRDLEVTLPDASQVITISYIDEDIDRAAAIATSFAKNYLDVTNRQVGEDLEAAAATLEQRVEAVVAELSVLRNQLDTAQREGDQVRQQVLENEQQILLIRLGSLRDGLSELETARAQNLSGEILVPADTANGAEILPFIRNGLLAAIIGLVFGGAFLLLREHLRDRFRRGSEIEITAGIPVLASIPTISEHVRGDRSHLLVEAPGHEASDAHRSFWISLQNAISPGQSVSVLVTSACPQEGKTTIASNLALAAAEVGNQVTLIECNLRTPTQESEGLATWLHDGKLDLKEVLTEGTVPNLSVIRSGRPNGTALPLITSSRMQSAIDQVSKESDIVILDGAHTMGVPDAIALAGRVDTCILVIDPAIANRAQVLDAQKALRRAGGNVIGAVLNRVDGSSSA